MKSRLLTKIADLDIHGEIFPTHRIIRADYEETPEEIKYSSSKIFESSGVRENVICTPHAAISNLRYFLDGSRKTYVIGNMTYNEKYVPVVAGQVGAACCERIGTKMKKVVVDRSLYLLLPSFIEPYDLEDITKLVNQECPVNITVDTYSYKEVENKPTVEFAIAKLNRLMHEKELKIINLLTSSYKLSPDKLLAVDGALRFQNKPNINFDNVVGVAKSFQTNLSGLVSPKKRQLGVIIKDLRWCERTPVFKVEYDDIGFWFVRIRKAKGISSPLDGIIKLEMYVQGGDEYLDSDIVDSVSRFIVNERNPVCYGKDARWQNHIYPIYVTEQLLKASFLSDQHFVNLF